MKKVILFVLLLGISLGLIISSTINVVYNDLYKELKDNAKNEKVVKTAKVNKNEEMQKENINKEEILNNTLQKQKQEEYVKIIIQEGHNSTQIADILYEKNLISSKEDFKILFNLKTLDIYAAGEVITQNGIISRGWKIKMLLDMINKGYNETVETLYTKKIIDDKDSSDFFLSILQTNKKIVPGEKVIKRGASMKEIIDIITK